LQLKIADYHYSLLDTIALLIINYFFM